MQMRPNRIRVLRSIGQYLLHRAQILLWEDEERSNGRLYVEIAERLQVHANTVHFVRKRFAEQGLQPRLERKKRLTPPNPPKVTGEMEAWIIELSCSEPPAGKSRCFFADSCRPSG